MESFVIVDRVMRIDGDFDFDDSVGFGDFVLFGQHYGAKAESENWCSRFDLDQDEEVGFGDFIIFVKNYGQEAN